MAQKTLTRRASRSWKSDLPNSKAVNKIGVDRLPSKLADRRRRRRGGVLNANARVYGSSVTTGRTRGENGVPISGLAQGTACLGILVIGIHCDMGEAWLQHFRLAEVMGRQIPRKEGVAIGLGEDAELVDGRRLT